MESVKYSQDTETVKAVNVNVNVYEILPFKGEMKLQAARQINLSEKFPLDTKQRMLIFGNLRETVGKICQYRFSRTTLVLHI